VAVSLRIASHSDLIKNPAAIPTNGGSFAYQICVIRDFGYRSLRFSVDFPVRLQRDDAGFPDVEGRCLEIAEDGMALRCAQALVVGTKVMARIILPGGPVALSAEVVHGREGGYGLSFLFSSQSERETVRRLLSSLGASVIPLRRSP
jgi:hypothetical protein